LRHRSAPFDTSGRPDSFSTFFVCLLLTAYCFTAYFLLTIPATNRSRAVTPPGDHRPRRSVRELPAALGEASGSTVLPSITLVDDPTTSDLLPRCMAMEPVVVASAMQGVHALPLEHHHVGLVQDAAEVVGARSRCWRARRWILHPGAIFLKHLLEASRLIRACAAGCSTGVTIRPRRCPRSGPLPRGRVNQLRPQARRARFVPREPLRPHREGDDVMWPCTSPRGESSLVPVGSAMMS